jgi:hypothetical protein
MSRHFLRLALALSALASIVNAAVAADVTIADWKFGAGAAFTTDSSGNGYTLNNNGATYGHDAAPVAHEPASGDFAVFNGSSNLRTSAPLSVSGYNELILTWSMKLESTTPAVVLETSTNFNNNPGAFIADANENPPGFTNPTGEAGVNIAAGKWNLADYSHAPGNAPAWDSYKMVIDLAAPSNSTVVQVYKNGVLDVNGAAYGLSDSIPHGFNFLNAIATIGAGGDNRAGFVGDIGEVKLVGAVVPEPASLLLLACGCAGLVALRLRGRSLARGARLAMLGAAVLLALAPLTGSASPLYSAAVTSTPGLVSYWRLGESTAATTAVDVKNNNPGTYVSPNTTAYGQTGAINADPNTAVHFDGSTSYVNAGNNASLTGNWTGGTLAAWINPDNLSQTALIEGTWANTLAGDRFGLFQNGNGLIVGVNDGSGNPSQDTALIVGSAGLTAGQYSFVVGTWNSAGNLALYVDGVQVGTMATSVTGLNTTTTTPFNIGAENAPSPPTPRFFAGKIDEAAVFSVALSQPQIMALYQAGISAATPEPGSVVLLTLGAAALIWPVALRRRRAGRDAVAGGASPC